MRVRRSGFIIKFFYAGLPAWKFLVRCAIALTLNASLAFFLIVRSKKSIVKRLHFLLQHIPPISEEVPNDGLGNYE